MTIFTAVPRPGSPDITGTIVSFGLDGNPTPAPIPISTGIPLPMGLVRDASRLRLTADDSLGAPARDVPIQCAPLAHWPNGTLRAVRLDFIATRQHDAPCQYHLIDAEPALSKDAPSDHLDLRIERDRLIAAIANLGDVELAFPLTSTAGGSDAPHWGNIEWLARGPIRWTARLVGRYPKHRTPRLILNISAFAGTPYLELSVTLLNPRRACHRGGLWDLGDKNAFHFRSFDVVARRPGHNDVHARIDPADPIRGPLTRAAIYQDSSGGDNWNGMNHVNHAGVVPCRFQGYEYHDNASHETGRRATPTFVLKGTQPLALTLPHFWQQFPKKISAVPGELRMGLFPAEWSDGHELQPGEQKTHSLWLSFDDNIDSLDFAHHPSLPILPSGWYAQCQLFDAFPPDPAHDSDRLRDYISAAIDPHAGLAARREIIDEYGWRHWGDLWADHERTSLADLPAISHYNNQYDVLEGCLRHFARSGNRAWWNLAAPLARHCVDIDIYHTDEDRPVYNHGLFWHTDHYQSARTATHRTYSRENAANRPYYGGGPSSSHCYSTGLLHLYYLSGDPAYREAVVGFADWLIAMEDGSRTEFGLIDSGPTGASTTSAEPWYHGPGRAPANTLNTLVDAWELTGHARYRDHAEVIIRRVVTPGEQLDALDLLDVERRWFYIMFLQSLAKYLAAKCVANENDAAYGYAVAAAQDYASWMLEHERPYFDHPQQLEYPTETWGAQDIRKANAMRQLARYCEQPLVERVLERARAIADRGWHDLLRFDTRHTLRPTAILLIEGPRDEFFRAKAEPPPPPPLHVPEVRATREPFVTQRDRVRAAIRTPKTALRVAGRMINPRHLENFIHAIRARL